MSITAARVEFDFAPKPESLDAESITASVSEWVNENLPFELGCGVYRAEDGYRRKKAMCYAQAVGAAALLGEWEIPAGIILTNTPIGHAAVQCLVPNPADKLQEVITIEPTLIGKPSYRNILDQVGWMTDTFDTSLIGFMSRHLPGALASSSYCFSFNHQRHHDGNRSWKITEGLVRTGLPGIQNSPGFVVIDPEQGRDMLESIGRLGSYLQSGDELARQRYTEAYPDLIHSVPDFIKFPEPRSV